MLHSKLEPAKAVDEKKVDEKNNYNLFAKVDTAIQSPKSSFNKQHSKMLFAYFCRIFISLQI